MLELVNILNDLRDAKTFTGRLSRIEELRGVIVHLGSRGDAETIEECTDHAIKTVTALLKKTKAKTRLLLETSAGPNRVASSFEQMRAILDGVGQPDRVGVCFDTCHVFVTGYDIRGTGMKKVLDEFDKHVGLKRLDVVHCNDTQATIGSGWDKHWHIGQGEIGEAAFKHLLRDKRLKDLSFILETPKKDKSPEIKEDPDAVNTAALKRLAGAT